MYTSKCKNFLQIRKLKYRDGIKSKGDKTGMPYTEYSDIRHVIPSPRESLRKCYIVASNDH